MDPSLLQASGFLGSWIPEALHVSLLAVETTASLLVRQAVVESSSGRAFGADTRLPGAAITLNTTDAFVSWLLHPFGRVPLRREANQLVSVASTQWQQQRSVERRKWKQHLRRHGIAQEKEDEESREDINGPDHSSDLQMTQQQQISDV
ncbi:unnamed protein product, partial [Protopolystoma xenopodis]